MTTMTEPDAPGVDPPPPPPPPDGAGADARYNGGMASLYYIIFVNLLLTIVTLGLYRFWAKTRLRRFLWAHTSIGGDRLEYAGTGSELLRGFLIVLFPILLPLFFVLGASGLAVEGFAPGWSWVIEVIRPWLLLFLIGIALYRARYYRLTRTRWRGIRAWQGGSAMRYAMVLTCGYIVTAFSAGLALPWIRVWLFRYKIDNTWLGDRRFAFSGSSGSVYPHFFAAWGLVFLIPVAVFVVILIAAVIGNVADSINTKSFITATPTAPEFDFDFEDFEDFENLELPAWAGGTIAAVVGVVFLGGLFAWQFYRAAEMRLFARATRLGRLRFALDLSGFALFRFSLVNFLIVLLTVGLGIPWVLHRSARFYAGRFQTVGALDGGTMGQNRLAGPDTGEGLADAFDVGF
jgi:uncharacterized membrane protein YjgN (DUF898 family)